MADPSTPLAELDWTGAPEWLQRELAGNALWRWLLALGVAAGAFALLLLVRSVLRRLAQRRADHEDDDTRADDDPGLLQRSLVRPSDLVETSRATRAWFLFALALYAGSLTLDLPPERRDLVAALATVVLVLQGGFWISSLALRALGRVADERRAREPGSVTGFHALGVLLRGAIWILVGLLALANLGIDVTGLIAGLGIGGIAIALALQNVLGDLFASLSIVLDKPFEVGDFIIVGDLMGTVETVGLKTTRVRSLSGEQLVFPNGDLLGSRIRNYKRMNERRVVFSFGVLYETPPEKVAAIPGTVREIVEARSRTRFDRAHFQGFGDSSLDFEVVYYMLVPDYNAMMDTRQAINLELLRRFAAQDIGFAYPTRTLYVQRDADERD